MSDIGLSIPILDEQYFTIDDGENNAITVTDTTIVLRGNPRALIWTIIQQYLINNIAGEKVRYLKIAISKREITMSLEPPYVTDSFNDQSEDGLRFKDEFIKICNLKVFW